MNIFVLGQSGSGKTPLSKLIGSKLGIPVISAGDWAVPVTPKAASKQDVIDETTKIAVANTRLDPNGCISYVKAKLSGPSIIEGIKNPRDFSSLFDPAQDLVVFLNRDNTPYRASVYEAGILVIDSYVNWLAGTGLLDKEKRVNFKYEIADLPSVADNFTKFFQYNDWCLICGEVGCGHQRA
jgi:hypothetical protein